MRLGALGRMRGLAWADESELPANKAVPTAPAAAVESSRNCRRFMTAPLLEPVVIAQQRKFPQSAFTVEGSWHHSRKWTERTILRAMGTKGSVAAPSQPPLRRPAVRRQNETVLWTTSCGLTCFVSRYEENRFQLRLARTGGTVKADLLGTRAEARIASHQWRYEVRHSCPDNWMRQLTRPGQTAHTGSFLRGG